MIPVYSPKRNSIHNIPTGAKMIYVAGGLAAVMLINHPLLLFVGLLAVAIVFLRAEELRSWMWYLKIFSVMGMVYFVLSTLFSNQGTHALLPWVTAEEVVFGISFVLKLMLTLSVFVLFSLTVHPDRLLDALGRKAVRSALALSISVRLFPPLLKDAGNIYEARISRGIPLDRGNVVNRWMKRIPLIVPLLSNALERTGTLAESMESRGFGRDSGEAKANKLSGRERWKRLRWKPSALSLGIISISGMIMLAALTQVGGWGLDTAYTVELELTTRDLVLGVLLFMIIVSPALTSAAKGGRG